MTKVNILFGVVERGKSDTKARTTNIAAKADWESTFFCDLPFVNLLDEFDVEYLEK
ncbi:hypothetical protein TVAG_071790 [Trichomonas vaginalis G3]|uniref:Uncharacterized protein n=1 Tax=Trichomonas vaginalis (strain ATCC PRA-98 / G3) TaxID=412133 RepID=A2D882_TRIV3|nr:hypothetical protein TVAGG3_1046900 [Trichomonas vaginalis G3]EAY23515.1 hypothetical protein TVAG_071790 [Trichomonas vaginalis G3]KAI5493937.1 hypothetical protein TVAGG3_1046900 [Trichomonas vaginalis G3]|eukprot:XP_001584501.1 hypothetical protein [Trichomonas vaginalis G3]